MPTLNAYINACKVKPISRKNKKRVKQNRFYVESRRCFPACGCLRKQTFALIVSNKMQTGLLSTTSGLRPKIPTKSILSHPFAGVVQLPNQSIANAEESVDVVSDDNKRAVSALFCSAVSFGSACAGASVAGSPPTTGCPASGSDSVVSEGADAPVFIDDLLAKVLLTDTITIIATAEKNNFFIILRFKLVKTGGTNAIEESFYALRQHCR